MEMIIIIVIIMIVMMVIGGGFTPTLITTEMIEVQRLNQDQWHCEEVVWTKAPEMHGFYFTGTLQLSCDVQAVGNNGGLVGLRKYMTEKIPVAVSSASEPEVINFEGLPAVAFDVVMNMKSSKDTAQVSGRTVIATDGFRTLRNVFTSDHVDGKGYAKALRSTQSELKVQTTANANWYHVTYSSSSEIEKPSMVMPGLFKNMLAKKMKSEFQDKAEAVVTNISNHL